MDTSRQSSGSFIPSSMYRRIEAIKHIKSAIRLFSYGTFIKKIHKRGLQKKISMYNKKCGESHDPNVGV